MEVVGEVGEWVGKRQRFGVGGGFVVVGEEDLGGFADEVAAGEEVASGVRGEGRRRGYLGGDGAAGWGGGGDLGGVLGAEMAARGAEGVEVV